MHLTLLLEMAADGYGDRVAVGPRSGGLTYTDLLARAREIGAWLANDGYERVGLIDVNSEAVPVLLFGSAFAGAAFVPVNYRLADEQLCRVLERTAPSVFVVGADIPARLGAVSDVRLVPTNELGAVAGSSGEGAREVVPRNDADAIAILLFTSGTTGEPKAAVLRHRHLTSYVFGTVEFMGADEDEASLVSVPPYHVAGTSAVLTSVYAGRRLVYLPAFSAEQWVEAARSEAITHAMVVPTMLGRILDVMTERGENLPDLRHLSYGGGRMPVPVVERALELLPHVDFVNAYGLTETSSTIAVLGPEDHRRAVTSREPSVRARLGSVGRPLPTLEVEIRSTDGKTLRPGETGELWVRGDQVAGEYLGQAGLGIDGWFPTRDAATLNEDGYLYLEGRLDDVIVRGGENMSPGEIEDALLSHPAVADAAVVGVPDSEWGEKVVAAVVLRDGGCVAEAELQEWVRGRLRSSRKPAHVDIRTQLPYNETGKLLRRALRAELVEAYGAD